MQNLRTKTPPWDSTTFSIFADNLPPSSPWLWAKVTSSVSLKEFADGSWQAVDSSSGRPFTTLHAVAQAPQPMHRVVSTRMDLLMFSYSSPGDAAGDTTSAPNPHLRCLQPLVACRQSQLRNAASGHFPKKQCPFERCRELGRKITQSATLSQLREYSDRIKPLAKGRGRDRHAADQLPGGTAARRPQSSFRTKKFVLEGPPDFRVEAPQGPRNDRAAVQTGRP